MASVINGLMKVTRKDVYKPLVIMTSIFLMIFIAGGLTITTYMVEWLQHPQYNETVSNVNNTVIKHVLSTSDSSYKYSVISGGLIFIANLCASILVIHVGINRLTTFALFCAAAGMALMGYSTLQMKNQYWSAIHVLSVWLVAFMFNFGPVNVTWGILGDIFPTDAKGFASVCVTIVAVTLAVSNKLYPYMVAAYGGYLYYAYAIVILLAAIFCRFFLPETVGKTLDQINETFL